MSVNVSIRPFPKESDFEIAFVELLQHHGWEDNVMLYPSEEDLVKNWAAILYNNNRDINRLGDFPLTDSEMQQIITKVDALKNPYETNQFINGQYVSIFRDNENDKINFGKSISRYLMPTRCAPAKASIRLRVSRVPKPLIPWLQIGAAT